MFGLKYIWCFLFVPSILIFFSPPHLPHTPQVGDTFQRRHFEREYAAFLLPEAEIHIFRCEYVYKYICSLCII